MATKAQMAREQALVKRIQGQMYRQAEGGKETRIATPREILKKIINSVDSTPDQVMEANLKLNKRPLDESPTRVRRRCKLCGRPRGVYRRFQLCRSCIRKLFVKGYLPGVVKSSW